MLKQFRGLFLPTVVYKHLTSYNPSLSGKKQGCNYECSRHIKMEYKLRKLYILTKTSRFTSYMEFPS